MGIGWGSRPCGIDCARPARGGWLLMSALPAIDQRQTRTAHIAPRPLPAAAPCELKRDWPALTLRAGFTVSMINLPGALVPGLYRNSHRLRLLPSRRRVSRCALLLPVEQGIRPTHHMQRRGSRPVAAHSLPGQQLFQAVTDRQIHHSSLSKSTCSIAPTSNRWMPKKCHFVTRSGQ